MIQKLGPRGVGDIEDGDEYKKEARTMAVLRASCGTLAQHAVRSAQPPWRYRRRCGTVSYSDDDGCDVGLMTAPFPDRHYTIIQRNATRAADIHVSGIRQWMCLPIVHGTNA